MTGPSPFTIYDDRTCALGEGPLWHPKRQEFFWFDINNNTLHSKAKSWALEVTASAAGWVDENTLLVASHLGLHRFDIETGTLHAAHVAIEADNQVTRSNDGRADPWGGFWIGTMGRKAEPNAGAIYRYFKGELRTIAPHISIPNATCFTHDRAFAYFTDTPTKTIQRVALDPATGWPAAEPEPWLTLGLDEGGPDGAVVDANGTFWLALWGSARVNAYAANGTLLASHKTGGKHTTCPAFGGPDLRDLFITSATEHLSEPFGDNGKTFLITDIAQGAPEYQVSL